MKKILILFTLVALPALFAFTDRPNPGWETGGKRVLLLGASTDLFHRIGGRHQLLPVSAFTNSPADLKKAVLAADALFLDESRFLNPTDLKNDACIRAALEYAKPIVVQNASADGIAGIAGAGFEAPVVVVRPLGRRTVHLTVLHNGETGEAPSADQVLEALAVPPAFDPGDGVTLPDYSVKTILADIQIPQVTFSRYICKSEKALSDANTQTAQVDIDLRIELYALAEAKYAKISSSGNGVSMGNLIRNDDKFRGVFLDQVNIQVISTAPKSFRVKFDQAAPESANHDQTVNTITSFGIANGAKGVPIPTFNNTRSVTSTLKDFSIENMSDSSQASWNYRMQLTKDGKKYTDPANIFYETGDSGFGVQGIHEAPDWAITTMPTHFETVLHVPATSTATIPFNFYRYIRGVSAHRWYQFGDLGANEGCLSTYPYAYNTAFSLDFGDIQAFSVAQNVSSLLSTPVTILTDITSDGTADYYASDLTAAPNGTTFTEIRQADINPPTLTTSYNQWNWPRIDIGPDGDFYSVDNTGNLQRASVESLGSHFKFTSLQVLDAGKNVLDVAGGPAHSVYYTTSNGINKIDGGGARSTLSAKGAASVYFNRIAVTASGDVFATERNDTKAAKGDTEVYKYDSIAQSWTDTGGKAVDLTTAGNYIIGVQSDRSVILYNAVTKGWDTVNKLKEGYLMQADEKIVAIDAAGSNSNFVLVATNRAVYKIFYR